MSEGTQSVSVIGVDVGGTFTDIVAVGPEGVRSWKTPTSDPQSQAVIEALDTAGIEAEGLFLHGTTVATNALLEESGAKVVLVTSAGFEDLVEIGRQKRPSLYDDAANRPRPLVARANRLGYQAGADVVDEVVASKPEAVAIGFLDSFVDPSDEQALAKKVSERLPDIPVSVGSQVSPGFREYERIESTVIDAYLRPLVGRYLRTIDRGVAATRKFVMTSSGGLAPLEVAAESVGQLTLSGPAAGVVAVDALRQHHGLTSAVAFDMGGTSTDVCRVDANGSPIAGFQTIGGRVNRVPSMPIHTVGAGGGSIAWVDAGGSLRVGPQSAGASPGPASYGLGGEEPTVTDANLLLGHIPHDSPLSGGLSLDVEFAEMVLANLGAVIGMSALDAARGVLDVVDAHMERAIRVVSVEEGFDPRAAVLVAYGGAGGLHASRLGRRLNMKSVMVPPYSGAFSAVGLALAQPRLETLRTVLCAPDDPALEEAVERLIEEVTQTFDRLHSEKPTDLEVLIDGRFVGQAHEISVPFRRGRVGPDISEAHERRYGFVIDGGKVEVVNVRGVAKGPAPLTWPLVSSDASQSNRPPNLESALIRSSMAPGFTADGPLVVVDYLSTTLVACDEHLEVLDDGTLEITW